MRSAFVMLAKMLAKIWCNSAFAIAYAHPSHFCAEIATPNATQRIGFVCERLSFVKDAATLQHLGTN